LDPPLIRCKPIIAECENRPYVQEDQRGAFSERLLIVIPRLTHRASGASWSAMIHFRALGVLSLRDSDEQEIEPALRRPKYLALLTYLAAARPRGFHRRDALVSLLWPELDQAHARSALRSAVHYLRRTLGPGVVVARGEEELGVDATMLWCDFAEFERALDAGSVLQTALELYRGEFLSGFHISDAPDFERWLDEVRDRLRRQAVEAARHLVAAEKQSGNVVAALEWMRRAVEISNHEEDDVRHLMELLAGAGDRPGALRAYGDLQRRLAAELDVEPSLATKALVDEIRSLPPLRSRIRASEKSREPVMPEYAAKEISTSLRSNAATTARGRPVTLRLLMVAFALMVALVAVLVAPRGTSQPDSRLTGSDSTLAAASDAMRVVVFPFAVRGGTDLGYLREGLPEVVSEAIDGLGDMRRVHPLEVLSRMHLETSQVMNQQQANRIASVLGARRYILGSVVGRGSRFDVSASLYDVGAAEPVAEASLEEGADRLGAVANRLTSALIADIPVGRGPRLRRLGATGTADFRALKGYSQGEALLRRARYDSAVMKLRDAVEADSTFALAWYRLGLAYSLSQSMGHEGDNHASLEKAMRYRDKLSPPDRLLLSGWYAHFHGQPEVAERVARQIIGGFPDDAEAWHLLGLTRMWYAWQRGRPYMEARSALARALEIDPRFPDAIYHARFAAILEARYAYADSVFRVAPTGLVTGPWAHAIRGLFAFVRGDRREQDNYMRSLETVDDQSLLGFAWILASHSDSLRAAGRSLSRFAGSGDHSDWGKTSGLIFLAHVEAARGRWGEAQALFRRAARSDAATALSSYAWLAAMPSSSVPRPSSRRLEIRCGTGRFLGHKATPAVSTPRRFQRC
jgi:DNA-binding SARP family transcriptional activator/Flp pilus assembly protein TadD